MLKKLLTLAVFGLTLAKAEAKTVYASQNGSGNGSGLDASDMVSVATLNASFGIYWTTNVNPGDTVLLNGVISTNIGVASSGTVASPITILFNTGASFSSPTMPPNSFIFYLLNQSNITINGQGATIQLTQNGDGLLYSNVPVVGIAAGDSSGLCTNILIENLNISNLFNRTNYSAHSIGGGNYGTGVQVSGQNITISNCYLSGMEVCFDAPLGGATYNSYTWIRNTLSNYCHGINLDIGSANSGVSTNVTIVSNYFMSGDMYQTTGSNDLGFHRDDFYFYDVSPDGSGAVSNLTFAYNWIQPGFQPGSGPLIGAGTSAIFFTTSYVTNIQYARVFNNVCKCTYPLYYSGGGGMINGQGSNCIVANNTSYEPYYPTNQAPCVSFGGTNVLNVNNICIGPNGYEASTITTNWSNVSLTNLIATFATGFTNDYNIYESNTQSFGSYSIGLFITNYYSHGSSYTATSWTNLAGIDTVNAAWDLHSTTNVVSINLTNMQVAINDTVANNQGTNLYILGITNDYYSNPRPSSGAWTIGAYQLVSSTPGILYIYAH